MKKYELTDLPYEYTELEPIISKDTLYYHHDFHHKGYVNKLNIALEQCQELAEKYTLEELLLNFKEFPKNLHNAIRNNAGGHINHTMFWDVMINKDKNETKLENYQELKTIINKSFGDFAGFFDSFLKAANGVFGSGWAWLVYCPKAKKLEIMTTQGHDNPLMIGKKPILVIDVWEHAYYLDYQNRRNEFVNNFQKIINWKTVSNLYQNAKK